MIGLEWCINCEEIGMSKNIKFGFYTIKAIHKESKKQECNITDLLKPIEAKPLDIKQKSNRYILLSSDAFITISFFNYANNGVLLKLRKCKHKDMKGSFLGKGNEEYDVGEVLNTSFNRDDSTSIEENFVKIFNNDIAIFQLYKNGVTINQFKYFLEENLKDYRFEIMSIYRDDLFQQLDNGSIKQVVLNVGFSPNTSKWEPESYSGATEIEVHFKRSKKTSSLNKNFFLPLFNNKKMANFGALDSGNITKAKAKLEGQNSFINLDYYELREEKTLSNLNAVEATLSQHGFFDDLFAKHKGFLEEYVTRDTRYND